MHTHGHEITTLGNRACYYEYCIAHKYLYMYRYVYILICQPYYDIYVEDATRSTRRSPFHAVSGQTNLSKLPFS